MEREGSKARELHRDFIVVDAHSDLLSDDTIYERIWKGRKGTMEEDWVPVMRKGGIDIRVVVVIESRCRIPEFALRGGLDVVSAFKKEIDESPSITQITKFEDVEKAKKDGKIGFILGMEGAEPLVNDIELLRIFYILGLRMLTLTWASRNYVGDGTHFLPRKEGKVGGITDFGVAVIKEANNLGIVIDVSHLNDPGFWDVIEFTRAPIVASHSNCRALADHPRNLTDDQIKAIIDNGGVIGMNSMGAYVSKGTPDLDHFLDHIDHIVTLGGIEHVGLGFDFIEFYLKHLSDEQRAAKFPNVAPRSLSGDEEVPNVTEGLVKRGYSDHDIELILGKNFLRVFNEVWK